MTWVSIASKTQFPSVRRRPLPVGWRRPRSDGDTIDVEVYGRKKQDAVYNYQGHRAYRPHIAFWAEGDVSWAADI